MRARIQKVICGQEAAVCRELCNLYGRSMLRPYDREFTQDPQYSPGGPVRILRTADLPDHLFAFSPGLGYNRL